MIGRTISRYRIIEQAGEGGMGVVYKAHDTHLDRFAAIKVLPREKVADQERKRRFVQEARAASALNHPNIVHIYDIDQQDGLDYIAMEYVEGRTLGEAIGRKGLKLNEALKFAIQIADALAGAHSAGIVHRDLKPGNVMVTAEGRVKVLDFGLAKLAETAVGPEDETRTAQQSTELGMVIGTAAYMSPEQAEGKRVDARSDIFSFGSVFYQMLTGRPAFRRDTPSLTLAAILHVEPPPLPPEIPQEVERVIGRCLRKDPARRFQTMADLKVTLEELKEESESGALAPASAAVAKSRKSPWLWVGTGIIALVLTVAVIWKLLAGTPGLSPASTIADLQVTQLTSTGKALGPAISPDGKYVAYVQQDGNEFSLWMRQIDTASQVQIVPPERGTYVDGVMVSPDGGFVDFVRGSLTVVHDEVWRVPFLGGTPKKLLDSYVSPVGWSADGRHIAFLRRGPKTLLITADADGSHERVIAALQPSGYFNARRPAWSVDGRIIAVAGPAPQASADRGQVNVVDVGTGAARVLPLSLAVSPSGPAWLDAGSLLISGVAESGGLDQLWKLSYPGGQLSRLTNDLSRYTGVSLTADRSSVVTARSDMRQSVWVGDRAAKSGAEIAPLAPGPWAASVAWAGERLLHVANVNGHTSVAFLNGRAAPDEIVTRGSQPVATSDGRTIVFVSNETGDGAGLWKVGTDGQHAVQLVSGNASWPVITSDDKRVIFVSSRGGAQRLWSVSIEGGSPMPLGDVFAYYPDVSPDGKSVVFGASNTRGELGICDLPACTNLRKVTTPQGGPISRWTPDGKGIAYFDVGAGGNLWVQPLDGSPRRQLTHFTDGLTISDFNWTRNGAHLAIVRTLATSDIVLIKGLRR